MAKKPVIAPRKPNPIDPLAAQRFLDGGNAEMQTAALAEVRELRSEHLKAVPPESTEPETNDHPAQAKSTPKPRQKASGRCVYTRTDGRTVRQVTVYLDVDIAKKLAHHCIDLDQDQSELVNRLVTEHLATAG